MFSISYSFKQNWNIHLLALTIALLLVYFKKHYVPSEQTEQDVRHEIVECVGNE